MISLIMVHINRPCLKRALACVEDYVDEIILIEEDMKNRKECITLHNEGVKKSKGDIILLMWERMVFQMDWKKKALKALDHIGGSGVVSFTPTYFSSGIVTRDFIEKDLGGNLWHPDYIHYCADIETADVARKRLKYIEIPIPEVHVWTEPKAEGENLSGGCIKFDEDTYRMRTNAGFPLKRMRTDEERLAVLKAM